MSDLTAADFDRQLAAVESFADHRVLLVGDWMLDEYVYGDTERISPEAPVPVLKVMDREVRAGGSGSVAAGLVALGLRVSCCGVIGKDDAGGQLIELLDAMGVETAAIVRDGGRPTTTKTRMVGLAQARHRQQLLRVDTEDVRPLQQAVAGAMEAAATGSVEAVEVVCLQGLRQGRGVRRHGASGD